MCSVLLPRYRLGPKPTATAPMRFAALIRLLSTAPDHPNETLARVAHYGVDVYARGRSADASAKRTNACTGAGGGHARCANTNAYGPVVIIAVG
eukprot:m.479677 g.479677  ORF g.479677 m.479677 type:complete len:94 (+) comp21704_c0_seq3:942-1223(+)